MSVTPESTLQSALDQFNHWRATRPRKGKIPEELIALLPSLLKSHTMGTLSKTLLLDYNLLRRMRQTNCAAIPLPNVQRKHPVFTECTLPDMHAGCSVEFMRPSGQTIKISGMTPEHLRSLAALLLEA